MDERSGSRGPQPDPGLIALVMMLRFQGLGVDPEQVRHQFGGMSIGIPEMLRYAKMLGLKAQASTTDWARLAKTPMPALAALRDGGFLLIGKAGEDKVIVLKPGDNRPMAITRNELEPVWDGRLVLMTKRLH